MHSFLPTYLGGTFSPLLDISERNIFPSGGGGGGVHVHPVHPLSPAYTPVFLYISFNQFTSKYIVRQTSNHYK